MSAWDSFRPARRFQLVWVALGLIFLLPTAVATYLHLLAPTDDTQATLASFDSYAVVTGLLAALAFLVATVRARRRAGPALLTALSSVLFGCHVGWVAPLFVPDDRPATTAGFSLLSLNTRHGTADADEVYRAGQQADVVVLLEATPEGLQRLQQRGWGRRFPYSAGVVRGIAGDTILYSSFPLSNRTQLPQSQFQQWMATADVPRVGRVQLIAAHPCNPYCGNGQFRRDHAVLRAFAAAHQDLPLVIAGDLNATDDHAPLRQLEADGMVSVTDILGAGWLPTYPANAAVPPLLPIDHVLVNRFLTATSVTRVHIADTDHLGLLTQLAATGTRSTSTR